MSEGPTKNGMQRVRHMALTLLAVAVAARIAWLLLDPLVPILVSLVVVLAVISVALFGWRPK